MALEILYAYLLGIFSIASPCAFILVPVLSAQAMRLRGTLVFLLGIVLSFGIAGALAAAIGKLVTNLFGQYVILLAASVTLLSALDLLGAFRIPFRPVFAGARAAGNFSQGMLFGGVSLTCIGPLMSAMLAYVLSTASIVQGFSLMLVYSLGFITPLLLFGVLLADADVRRRIRGSHAFIRRAAGCVLLLASLYLFLLGAGAFA